MENMFSKCCSAKVYDNDPKDVCFTSKQIRCSNCGLICQIVGEKNEKIKEIDLVIFRMNENAVLVPYLNTQIYKDKKLFTNTIQLIEQWVIYQKENIEVILNNFNTPSTPPQE